MPLHVPLLRVIEAISSSATSFSCKSLNQIRGNDVLPGAIIVNLQPQPGRRPALLGKVFLSNDPAERGRPSRETSGSLHGYRQPFGYFAWGDTNVRSRQPAGREAALSCTEEAESQPERVPGDEGEGSLRARPGGWEEEKETEESPNWQ